MQTRILFLILIALLFSCKDDTTKSNPYAAMLVGGRTPYSPAIFSIEPKRGNPAFSTPELPAIIMAANYEATMITVRGRNFIPSLTGNTVLINDAQATVEFATDEELRFRIPNGATSGVLSVANNGGSCNGIDKKIGINCEGQDFFIDCYNPYNGIYGSEINIPSGTNYSYPLTKVGTKAFRSDLLPTDLFTNGVAGNTIQIICSTLTRVVLFSQSCVPTEHTVNGTSLVLNPTISVNSKFYTIQYQITAGKGNCAIRVN